MALHRMVNGQKVDLTEEEEAAVRAEWAENAEKKGLAQEAHRQKLAKRQQIKEAMMAKMELSEEDFDLLFNLRG